MEKAPLPSKFIKNIFVERKELIKRVIEGKSTREDFLIGFLRHTPAVATYGPAGLNASIKGVGFIVKEEYLETATNIILEQLSRGVDRITALKILLETVYDEDKVDFTKLTSIELAKKHTWVNVLENPEATILFYIPPNITYEVRCTVTIHENDIYWKYVNAVHDLFHGGRKARDWSKTPVYLFHIKEIYDNDPKLMGEKIYP
ncbi:MAG: hypothetical protein DRJ52_02890 [Thermoprotei archaeon]|nr:MAG: hypothetical protein DRJ52_02890 [Thermoprotei archaeon]RLF00849.1 MAG: hypothetical protein DRJ63_01105 [Thermoprotei archaeon]